MANHATARFRKPVDGAWLNLSFNAINAGRFDNFFAINYEIAEEFLYWNFRNSTDLVLDFSTWFYPGSRLLEWRHPRGLDVALWCHEYFMSLAITITCKTMIHDEGISEALKPNFYDKYPRYSEWLKDLDTTLDKSMWLPVFEALPERLRTIVG